MIRLSRPSPRSDEPSHAAPHDSDQHPVDEERPYGLAFWRAYVANGLVMAAVALLFRYADFVTLLGGTELHLGWIVGIGMVGSLSVRLFLGTGIDRYGARIIWPGSLVVLAASCFAHLAVTSYQGPAIFLLRVLYCSAFAGAFGSSVTFVSHRVPVARMAEMIGMLGTAGFAGIVVGAQLGDILLGMPTIARWQVDRMFLAAGMLVLCALPFACLATFHQTPPRVERRPPLLWLLGRYHPGMVMLVAVAMGAGISLPAIFLRTYVAQLGITRIGAFFAVYAPTAVVTRLLTRRLPERFGLKPMILFGLGTMAVSQLLFLTVGSAWQLILPGIGYGVSHAVLFPATLAAGSRVFPSRYRGLGSIFMLAMFDMGQLVGAPTAGVIVHCSTALALPGYPTLFLTAAGFLAMVAAAYAWSRRKGSDSGQNSFSVK